MATTILTDFKIYQEEFQAGLWESETQHYKVFNEASGGSIQLIQQDRVGEYEKNAFLKAQANLVTRRDVTSVAAATAAKMTQGEHVGVKLNRKIGPVELTLDAIKKIGSDHRHISFVLGQMAGEAKAVEMLNTAIAAAEAAIANVAALNYDATGETVKTLMTEYLVSGMSKLGDQGQRVSSWVGYSKPFWDLVKDQIAGKVTNVADRVIYGASPGTLSKPFIVSDIPALWDLNGSATDTYNTLGLVQGAITIKDSETSEMITEIVTGLENLVLRVQGEFAYNLSMKGFAWDITNGAANPDATAVATGSNWDKVATSDKDLAGVRIKTQ